MTQAYSLATQAALGNRFARILLAAMHYRATRDQRRERRDLAMLIRRRMWLTPDGPRRDQAQEQTRREEGGT